MNNDQEPVIQLVFENVEGMNPDAILEFCRSQFQTPIRSCAPTGSRLEVKCGAFDLREILVEAQAGRCVCQGGETTKRLLEIWDGDNLVFEAVPDVVPKRPQYQDLEREQFSNLLERVDVLLVTATQVEMNAVVNMLNPLPSQTLIARGPVDNITLRIGLLGRYVCAHLQCSMGSNGRRGSTLSVSDAMRVISPKAIFIVGIAFGANKRKQHLGDVLLAESIIPYEMRREGLHDVVYRGQQLPCGIKLSSRFSDLSDDWLLQRYCNPVKCYRGDILSGDVLVDDPEFKNKLLDDFPTALGGEMEGAGAYAAGMARNVEILLIKGICDWADGTKTDYAQPFAAHAAISLVAHVLAKPDVLADLGCRDQTQPTDKKSKDAPLSELPATEKKSKATAVYRLLSLIGIKKTTQKGVVENSTLSGQRISETVEVSIKIEGEIDIKTVLTTLDRLTKASGTSRINCHIVRRGSIIFELEMPLNAFLVLGDLFETGELNEIINKKVIEFSKIEKHEFYLLRRNREVSRRPEQRVTVVCHLNTIEGFETEFKEAVRLLGNNATRSLTDCLVYVSAREGILYVQSNFIKQGRKYPTKIATSETTDLLKIFHNLIADNAEDFNTDEVVRLHRNVVKYVVNAKLVGLDQKLLIDVEGAKNVLIVVP